MSENTSDIDIISLISAPAFAVCDDTITCCNDAAQRLLLVPGTSIGSLLPKSQADYTDFEDGCLFLTLKHNNYDYGASVVRVGCANIFVLEEESDQTELRTLSLTASNMRQPLSAMIATTANLTSALEQTADPKLHTHLQEINRNLHRMHRMLCNMSDAIQYADGISNHMVCMNVVSVAQGIFQQAQQLCKESGFQLEYSIPDEMILCTIDEALLERAIYNMLSNAMKFSPAGSVIQASLVHRNNQICISVIDRGSGIPQSIKNSVFRRYQRYPGLEDGRFGLGLGLVLVRSAARVHGGTVLVDHPNPVGTRITLNIPIRKSSATLVRSNINRVDYAGGWDHGLLELSDIMPAHLY